MAAAVAARRCARVDRGPTTARFAPVRRPCHVARAFDLAAPSPAAGRRFPRGRAPAPGRLEARALARIGARPARAPGVATMAMQSTGQGGTHRSQPVHSAGDRVHRFAAPTMASTGQAWMHSVQPIQALVDHRDGRGLSTPLAGLSGSGRRPVNAARRDALRAARRALVDRARARGDRLA